MPRKKLPFAEGSFFLCPLDICEQTFYNIFISPAEGPAKGGAAVENGILHVDMNNFYASVETLYAPQYRDVPMAVAGDRESRHGIILAKNMLAKRRGVQTAEPIWQAMKKCPGLQLVPPHHERYAMFSEMAKRIYCDYTDQVEAFSLDECWLDVYGSGRLFGSGRDIAEQIRARVKSELGLTVSVGVSYNKVFAKLGSDYKKPDAVTEFGHREMETIIWGLPAGELLMVGPTTQAALKKYGISTIGDIARMELTAMRRMLGRTGETLWIYANGLDDSPVRRVDAHEDPKSIGSSTTLPRDITTDKDVRETLMGLSETVAARLRRSGLKAGEVQITIKNAEFQEVQRQRQLAAAVCDSRSLYEAAWDLYRRENKRWAVRLLGVRAGRLVQACESQISFFDDSDGLLRRERLESAVDRVREKYGGGSISRAFVVRPREEDGHE